MRESGESIVYFVGKFTLDWLYVTRLQHHLKTKCKIPLKSTWSPKFSIFLGYLPRIWFNLINYTFHVFKVVKNSQYQKFYSSKIKFFRCYKRYLCEAGERVYSITECAHCRWRDLPTNTQLQAADWLLRLLRPGMTLAARAHTARHCTICYCLGWRPGIDSQTQRSVQFTGSCSIPLVASQPGPAN